MGKVNLEIVTPHGKTKKFTKNIGIVGDFLLAVLVGFIGTICMLIIILFCLAIIACICAIPVLTITALLGIL